MCVGSSLVLLSLQGFLLEVGKQVRHAFRTERDERPRVKRKEAEKEEEEENEILPITCKEVQEDTKPRVGEGSTDPDVSLITDFQLITDLRVSPS